MKHLIYITILLITFSSCEKIIPDLPRDNLNDIYNPDNTDTEQETGSPSLEFSKYEIAEETVPYGSSPNGVINAGEYIYLLVYVKNLKLNKN